MDDCTCGPGVRWCARADALLDVSGLHVLDVARDEDGRLLLAVESDQTMAGCPGEVVPRVVEVEVAVPRSMPAGW